MPCPSPDDRRAAPSEPPPRPKLVILRRSASVHDAARAMQDNHVGSVLVVDSHHRLVGIVTDRDLALAIARPDFHPHATPVSAVMTDIVGTCAADARTVDVVCTMKQFACRRVPLLEHGRPVGLVTLDDLLIEGSASCEDIRAIVSAQLAMPARHKPAGSIRPGGAGEQEGPSSLDRRREARLEQTWRELVREVDEQTGVGSREQAETALRIVLGMLCRRFPPEDARRLVEALPAALREQLADDVDAPDEPVTLGKIGAELHRRLGLPPDAAVDILLSLGDTVAAVAGQGDGTAPGSRLRWFIRELFPRRARV